MITAGKDAVRLRLRRGHDLAAVGRHDSLAAAAALEAHWDPDRERATIDLDVGARIEPNQLISSILRGG